MTSPKPEPMVCPVCFEATDWIPGPDGHWELDGEWWYDPFADAPRSGYVDSRRCYLKRVAQSQRRSV